LDLYKHRTPPIHYRWKKIK